MAAATTLKLGAWVPLTDGFVAHPANPNNAIIDLNDGVTFSILDDEEGLGRGLDWGTPSATLATSSNLRVRGERVTRRIYNANRTITVRLYWGPGATYSAWSAALAALKLTCEGISDLTPAALQIVASGSATTVYADVVAAQVILPYQETLWMQRQSDEVTVIFTCKPIFRGSLQTLDNLVVNPGFEAPSGPLVRVFDDSFTTANAYSVLFGGAPSVAGNVMTLAATSLVTFGSPAWGAVGQWRLRWRWQTGLVAYFYLHFVDSNNWLGVQCEGATLQFIQSIGGVQHQLANVGAALTNGTFYWLLLTQFPSVANDPPDVAATLSSDSGGSLGAQLVGTGPVPAFDAVTALSGKMAIQANNTIMQVGGAFPDVHQVSLFGPGGWAFSPTDGSTGPASGAWDGSVAGAPTSTNANTYPGGPVTSFGAARIEYPPAGTATAWWTGSTCPAAAGQVVRASVWVRSSGLHATNGVVTLFLNENNASGGFLRQDTVASVVGSVSNAGWTQLSGSVTLGADCASVTVICQTRDLTVAGESAGARVWFDNAQVWNQTTTGQSSMPYCELRFPQSPAQLMVSGLQGDVSVPAFVALATYVGSWAPGSTLRYALGRRALFSRGAQLVANGVITPSSTRFQVLDSTSYGGFYTSFSAGNGTGFSVYYASGRPADLLGTYHLLNRVFSAEVVGNLPLVTTRIVANEQFEPWIPITPGYAQFFAQFTSPGPLTASNTWTMADSGRVPIPPFPTGALTDLAQNYFTVHATWSNPNNLAARSNWGALLPVDASLLLGIINQPSNDGWTPTNAWVWAYFDGLLAERGTLFDRSSATRSIETVPLPNPGQGVGGPGTINSGSININQTGNSEMRLDPSLGATQGMGGINQFVGVFTDGNGGVLPLHMQVRYIPGYLYPP